MTVLRAVAVATATLWSGPGAPRLIDAPALAVPAQVREWTGLMDSADRLDLHGRVQSQALLGEPVLVEEERDGWARVVLPAQPSSKDARGYPGWLPSAQLVDWDRPSTAPAVVRVPTTALHHSPAGDVAVADVSFATALPLAGGAVDGWLPVHVPDRDEPGWLPESAVEIDPAGAPAPGDLLAAARQFCDLPYLWGGTSGLGLDCSGLVHVVYRRFGLAVPRDAHDQAAAGQVRVSPADAVAGDLLFFARPDQEVHHVGIATGSGWMLHSPETGRGITEEPLAPQRLDTLVGAGRWQ